MRTVILKLLPRIVRLHSSNKKERRQEYPQTWWLMPKNKRMKKFIQSICGFVTGHEMSKTERGYGGGKFIDCNCRWCDHVIKVPVVECNVGPIMKDLMGEIS